MNLSVSFYGSERVCVGNGFLFSLFNSMDSVTESLLFKWYDPESDHYCEDGINFSWIIDISVTVCIPYLPNVNKVWLLKDREGCRLDMLVGDYEIILFRMFLVVLPLVYTGILLGGGCFFFWVVNFFSIEI